MEDLGHRCKLFTLVVPDFYRNVKICPALKLEYLNFLSNTTLCLHYLIYRYWYIKEFCKGDLSMTNFATMVSSFNSYSNTMHSSIQVWFQPYVLEQKATKRTTF